jgi:hypothetical protein
MAAEGGWSIHLLFADLRPRSSDRLQLIDGREHRKRFAATLIVISIGLSACNRAVPTGARPPRTTELAISLRSLGINQSEKFREVRAAALPTAVLDQMGGVADAGQPFNATDAVDPKLPMTRLVVAAVSEHYCALSYWKGGYATSFNTSIFGLSGGSVRLIWVSHGQGGLDLQDLKEMIESGKLHNDLP